MKKQLIFIQSNDLIGVHSVINKKYQRFFSGLVYVTFFVISYLTMNFLLQTTSNAISLEKNYLPYVSEFIFQFIHTSFAIYFLGIAFVRLYQSHRDIRVYLIWMFVYFASGIVIYGLWFYFRNLIDFNEGPVTKLIFFKYVFYFIFYGLLLELAYISFFLKFNARINPIANAAYKAYIFQLLIFLVYTIIFMIIFSGDANAVINRLNKIIIPFFVNGFSTVNKAIGILILFFFLFIPFLFILIIHLKVKKYIKQKLMSQIFSARMVYAFLVSVFLHYTINQSKSIANFYFGTINYVYIILAIVFLIFFFVLIIWNQKKFNSSISYYLIISFIFLLLSWFLGILYITRDIFNHFSRINSIILAVCAMVIFTTSFFNRFLIKRLISFFFHLIFNIIAILFLIIYILDSSNLSQILSDTFDPFFLLYILIAILTLINLNILLVSFTHSLKRLAVQPKKHFWKNIFKLKNKSIKLV